MLSTSAALATPIHSTRLTNTATPAIQENLTSYGENLGIAFQLVDDHLDYVADEVELGKPVGGDFRDGKLTLPVVLALQRGTPKEQHFWRRALEDRRQRTGDFEHAMTLLTKYDALTDTLDLARSYIDRACTVLEGLPANRYRDALRDSALFCMERTY